MSVDEYNRRVPASTPDSVAGAPKSDADFTYTRRLERFHNPDIVAQSGDEELVEYYYATEQPTVINVNVIDIDPWNWWGPSWGWRYSSWYSPYWNPYYSFGWGPSWNWGWGPSWSWGWGGWYDPYWSWAGGWGPAWGWGPALPPPDPPGAATTHGVRRDPAPTARIVRPQVRAWHPPTVPAITVSPPTVARATTDTAQLQCGRSQRQALFVGHYHNGPWPIWQ